MEMTWENLIEFFQSVKETGSMYIVPPIVGDDSLLLDGLIYKTELEKFVKEKAGSTPAR